MKIKDGFNIRKISNLYMAVPVGERTSDAYGVISLSETGAFLWNLLQEESSIDKLVTSILSEYDVSSEKAREDVVNYLEYLRSQELLDE